jgi:hypothetical protein
MKTKTSKEDISKLDKRGHFYFALTPKVKICTRNVLMSPFLQS